MLAGEDAFVSGKLQNYGGPHLPRQNLLSPGKTYFYTAIKTYFLTAKLTFPRQNLRSHGKTYFSTPKLAFPPLASSLSPILKSLVY